MGRKPKFKPEIRRVKLNPEQAVLTCDCYTTASLGANRAVRGNRYTLGNYQTGLRSFFCLARVKHILKTIPGTWDYISGTPSS